MTPSPRPIEIAIPVDLTARKILGVDPWISNQAADALAAELHDIIGLVRAFYSIHPAQGALAPTESELANLIETMMSTAIGVWPIDPHDAEEQAAGCSNDF